MADKNYEPKMFFTKENLHMLDIDLAIKELERLKELGCTLTSLSINTVDDSIHLLGIRFDLEEETTEIKNNS